jgi:hypothetical protein
VRERCRGCQADGFATAYSAFATSLLILFAIVDLTGCSIVSRHQFAEPRDWQSRNGQLLYRNATTTLIGEVLIRYSASGDFEMTFSKGPGLTLLTLRQDANFAEVRGALAGRGWSGPVEHAPKELRSWLQVREKVIHDQNQRSIRYSAGTETFQFHF